MTHRLIEIIRMTTPLSFNYHILQKGWQIFPSAERVTEHEGLFPRSHAPAWECIPG